MNLERLLADESVEAVHALGDRDEPLEHCRRVEVGA
jgi:hypothetical protein